jgi:hypothetical protein
MESSASASAPPQPPHALPIDLVSLALGFVIAGAVLASERQTVFAGDHDATRAPRRQSPERA